MPMSMPLGDTPRRVTRRRVATRARLLDAAFTVFAAKGFGRVSIEEICDAAGYSRGAFYSNFATLDELFFALYQDRADLIAAQVAEALAQDGPGLDVPAAVDRVTEVLLLDVDWLLVKTDFLVHAARDPDVARALLDHRARLREAVAGSPRQYQAAQRAGVLRDALQRGRDVTRATHDAGFGSASRMYEAVPAELGMTPSAFKRQGAGLTVRYASAETPLGTVLVAATDKGVCKIAFGDDAGALVEQLAADFAQAERVEDHAKLEPFIAQIRAYLQGTRERFDLPLDIGATAFQRRVWDALRRIPYGQTRSYSDVADALGSPHAVRAVANACASNPVALAIPCHRVIGKDGAIAGYRWGKPRKEALLETERTHHAVNKVA